ncbi:MAG: Ig-like domain-containing protein [Taibaiella sp.]|nr:Ig-like domain-containing protein [Taibaiella sp.]
MSNLIKLFVSLVWFGYAANIVEAKTNDVRASSNSLPLSGAKLSGVFQSVMGSKMTPAMNTEKRELAFIENVGQVKDQYNKVRGDVQYKLAAAAGLNIFIGSGAIHYQFAKCDDPDALKRRMPFSGESIGNAMKWPGNENPISWSMHRLDVTLVGANENATIIADDTCNYYAQYYIASTNRCVQSVAHSYRRVTYKNIYPNIDWVLYVKSGELKYEFVVNKGGRIEDIKLRYGGASRVKLTTDGSVVASTSMGNVVEQPPYTYQVDGKRIKSKFKLKGNILSYDVSDFQGEIVIDPSLGWSINFGGSHIEWGFSVAADSHGNSFLGGITLSVSDIATAGAFDETLNDGTASDAFLAKFDQDGVCLWSTYYGGEDNDHGYSVCADKTGNVWLAGMTNSVTGIATAGAHSEVLSSDPDAFIVKFNSSGERLWGTYFGGSGSEEGLALAVDGSGSVWLSGNTTSLDGIATVDGFDTTLAVGLDPDNPGQDAFIAKFDSDGVQVWGSYYGGNETDVAHSVAVDTMGNVWLAGNTYSPSEIATTGADDETIAGSDCFVVKFGVSGEREWATYVGGEGEESSFNRNSLAVSANGDAYLTGATSSSSGIATTGAFKSTLGGSTDAFLTKFNSSGIKQWSTYYGGENGDAGGAIAVDDSGNVWVTGGTSSPTGIATSDAYDTTCDIDYQSAFLAKFSTDGELIWGTYFGDTTFGYSVAVDNGQNVIIAGTKGFFVDVSLGTEQDAFLAKFIVNPLPSGIEGALTVCAGAIATLTDSVSGGIWSSSDTGVATIDSASGIVTGIAAGTTVISYTVVGGSVTAVVTVNSLPDAGTITGSSSVNVGSTITLSNAISGGTWSSSNTSLATVGSSGVVTGISAGILEISYLVGNACGSSVVSASVTVIVFCGTTITTIAGTGTDGFDGDGYPATLHKLYSPADVVVDNSGNIYLADMNNKRIRKVAVDGTISTIAGTGVNGYSGDGGPATLAQLSNPAAVALDGAGNIYVAENGNSVIRKIRLDGTISTVAGLGTSGFSGDGGPATNAQLSYPKGVCVDNVGNIYISDNFNNRIRRVDTLGIITTVVGSGAAGFSGDGGMATAAALHWPEKIAVDAIGNLYIAENVNSRIRKVSAVDGIITTIAGNGDYGYNGDGILATSAQLNWPAGVAVDAAGNVYIGDYENSRIRKVGLDGIISTVVGNGTPGYGGDGGPATAALIYSPTGVCVNSTGDVFLSDPLNSTIRRISSSINIFGITGPSTVCAGSTITLSDTTGGGSWSSGSMSIATIGSTGVLIGVAPGTTAISYTVTNSCGEVHATKVITVNPLPDAGTITGPLSVDVGLTITLADTAAGGVWSSSNTSVATIGSSGIVTGIAAGTAVISYTVTNSCGSAVATLTITVAVAGTCYLPVSGLVAWYPFSGNAGDSSGNGHHGIVHGATLTTDRFGNPNSAYDFSDSAAVFGSAAQWIEVPYSSQFSTPAISVSAWVNARDFYWPGNSIHSSCVVSRWDGGCSSPNPSSYRMMINEGGIFEPGVVRSSSEFSSTVDSPSLTTNSWYHLVTTFSSDTIKSYINGILVKQEYAPGTINTTSTCLSISIGDNWAQNGHWYYFNGKIDDIAIYNRALTPSEVSLLYSGSASAGTITGPSTVTVGSAIALSNSVSGGTWSSSNTSVATVGSTGVVTGVALGTAVISYMVANSCGSASTSFGIVVNVPCSSIISTVAGNGTLGYTGDGATATAASINQPYGLCVDGSGNVFVAQYGNDVIRKISVSGLITTFAGNGVGSFSGDGGQATSASLNDPFDVTVDGDGNLYVAEYTTGRIRMIDTSGTISTFAGTTTGYDGDGGLATDAKLSLPRGVAVDHSGNLFIADWGNNRIRKIDASGIISTIAGTGISGYNGDGIAATAARLNRPTELAVDSSGNIFFSDAGNERVRRIGVDGIIQTIAGTGIGGYNGDSILATSAMLSDPEGIDVDLAGNIYISDNNNHRIRKVNASGMITTLAGIGSAGYSGDAGLATLSELHHPVGVAVDSHGNIYISDNSNSRIRLVSAGAYVAAISGTAVVCQGNSTALADSVSGGYWTTSSAAVATIDSTGVVLGVAAGTATISYTITNSCGSATATKVITVNPLPDAGNITGPSTVNVGSTISLADTAGGGVWTSSNTSVATVGSSGIVTGIAAGTAVVSYTVTNSCGSAVATFSLSVASPLPCYLPVSGLVAWYPFAGNANDSSGNGFHGSVSGATLTTDRFGNANSSYYFNGTSNFIQLPFAANTNTYSISLWVRPDALGSQMAMMGNDDEANSSRGFWLDGSGTPKVHNCHPYVPSSCTHILSSGAVAAAQWSHVVCAVSSGTVTFYINGVAAGTASGVESYGTNWRVGIKGVSTTQVPFLGKIDDIAFYTQALTAIEVLQLYQAGASAGSVTGAAVVCAGSTTTLSDTVSGGSWSSSNASIVIIGSTGVVTGVAPGTAIISYTVTNSCGSASATKIVTVNPLADAGTITGPDTVIVDSVISLVSSGSGGTWLSSNAGVATVSSSGVVIGVSIGTAIISYVVSNSCGSDTATKAIVVSSIAGCTEITGPSGTCIGSSVTLSASVSGGTWFSSAPSIATVGSVSGVVTGVANGTTNITYTLPSGCYAVQQMTVGLAPISGTPYVCIGTITELSHPVAGGTWSSSTSYYSSVDPVTGVVTGIHPGGYTTVTYSLVSGCSVSASIYTSNIVLNITGGLSTCEGATTSLSVPGYPGGTWHIADSATVFINMTTGVMLGIATGTMAITYSYGYCYTSAVATVNPVPASITGGSEVCMGSTLSLSCSTAGGAWSSSNTAKATVDGSGTVTGVASGTATISYALGTGCAATKVVTVGGMPAAISGTTTLCEGATTTLSCTSTGGTWSSSATGTADVTSTVVTGVASYALISGIAAGGATISYNYPGGCVQTVNVTVAAPPASIGGTLDICVGGTSTLTGGGGGTWSSSTTTVATIGSSTGIATGSSAGTSTITYRTSATCYTTSVVTVSVPAAISGAASVCKTYTTTFTHAVGGGTWSSSNAAVASVDASGVVTGVLAGSATITYNISTGCYAVKTIYVYNNPTAITGTASVCAGANTTLTGATGTTAVWSSSNGSVATVGSSSGVVTGVAAGNADITFTATATGCFSTRNVTVNEAPTAITGASTLCVGADETYMSTPTGGAWSSTAPTVGSINATTGIATGRAAGGTSIKYTLSNGCYVLKAVTVTALPGGITGTSIVCVGNSVVLTAASAGSTWSTSAAGTASITATTTSTATVAGISAGVANISYTNAAGCYRTYAVTVNAALADIAGDDIVCSTGTITLTDATTGGTWSSNATGKVSVGATTGIATGGATLGTAVISYKVGAGCYTTKSITNNAALPSILGGGTNMCSGADGAVTLTNAVSGGTWSSSNTSVAVVDGTTGVVTGVLMGGSNTYVYITYATSAGCTKVRSMLVKPQPIITGAEEVSVGSTTAMTGSPTTGTWGTSAATIANITGAGVVIGVSAGSATISYTLAGCVNTKGITVTGTASRPAGMTEEAVTLFSVFPNPSHGSLSVSTGVAGTFTIYTVDGKTVATRQLNEGLSDVGMPVGLSAGIYMCYFSGVDGSKQTARLIYEP